MTVYAQDRGAVQASLFDAEEVGVDEAFSTTRRIWLDEISWIEHVPGWLGGNGAENPGRPAQQPELHQHAPGLALRP